MPCSLKTACAMQYGTQSAAPQQQYTEVHASSSVYVKNLPQDADKLYLYEKFAPFGGISSVKVRASSGPHARRHVTVQQCCTPNQTMCTAPPGQSAMLIPSIGGWAEVPLGLIFSPLAVEFSRRSQITDILACLAPQVMRDDQGKARGFGFVNFTSPVAASGAVAAVHGTLAGDKSLHASLQTAGGRLQPKRI